MEFTCSLLNIKLTEIFKVNFAQIMENLFIFFPIFQKNYSTSHTTIYAHVHTHTHTHTLTQTSTTLYLPALEYI